MQSSKFIISTLLISSIIISAIIPNYFHSTNKEYTNSPIALNYSFDYSNTTLDLKVTSSIPSYLFIETEFNNSTFINTSQNLKTDHIFSFKYYNSYFKIKAGLFTDTMNKSDLNIFIYNKTIFQPLPFIVNYSISQFLNKTQINLSTTTKLNLNNTFADKINKLSFIGLKNNYFLYNYSTESNNSSLFLEDTFNRTWAKNLQFQKLSSNINNTEQNALDFSYDYQIINKTSLTINLSVSELSSAMIKLYSTEESRSVYSSTISNQHSFFFSNLSFTTYEAFMTVFTSDKALNKNITISINDTSTPVITKYTITTGLSYINTSFTFSKNVKVDYYLVNPTGYINTTIGLNYIKEEKKEFSVSIGEYNLTLRITDEANHIKQFEFPFIRTQILNVTSYISLTTNTSVITDKTKAIELYPVVVFNNSRVFLNEKMNINLSSSSLVFQSSAIQLKNKSILLINQDSLNLLLTSEITLTASLPIYHLQTQRKTQFVLSKNQNINPNEISLQSYVSNVSVGETIALHLSGSGFLKANNAYIDIYSQSLGYSIAFSSVVIYNGGLESNLFLTIPQESFNYLNLTTRVIFDKNYYSAEAHLRIEITNGTDTSNPIANVGYKIANINQSLSFKMNTSEPVKFELFYALTKTLFSSIILYNNYQSEFNVNLSSILFQNKTNYFYVKIQDSNFHTNIYDNNSNYFTVFIPKIDFTLPYNTTNFAIDQIGIFSFQANEDVTAVIMCYDTSGILGNYQCGQVNSFSSLLNVTLQFSFTSLEYVIYQVRLTDKAGNTSLISVNLHYIT